MKTTQFLLLFFNYFKLVLGNPQKKKKKREVQFDFMASIEFFSLKYLLKNK